jgi:hypothetical protein
MGVADEMGLGKTIQAISFMMCLRHEKLSSKPFLVIAPKSTLPGWEQVYSILSVCVSLLFLPRLKFLHYSLSRTCHYVKYMFFSQQKLIMKMWNWSLLSILFLFMFTI